MANVSDLIKQLAAADPAVREQAAWELGNLGPAAAPAAEALARALIQESLRGCAGWALVKIGGPAVEALVRVLGHPSASVRLAAVSALWKIAPERGQVVLDALAIALLDADASVRAYTAWSLGEVGRAAEPVAGTLASCLADPATSVRKQVAEALGRIGAAEPAVVRALTAAVDDPESAVRWEAVGSLLRLASIWRSAELRHALPALERAARQGPRGERGLCRSAAAAIRASAPRLRGLPPSTRDSLPRPAAAPDYEVSTLPRPADEDKL